MEDDNSASSSLNSKDSAIASIESAQAELQDAVEKINELPTLDQMPSGMLLMQ